MSSNRVAIRAIKSPPPTSHFRAPLPCSQTIVGVISFHVHDKITPARVLHHGPRGPSTCAAPHPTVWLPSIDLPSESPSPRRPCHAGSAPGNFCCNPGRAASPPERGQGPWLATSPSGQRQCPDEVAAPPATSVVQRLLPSEVPDKRSLLQGKGKIQAGPRCVASILMAPLPPTRRERSACRVPLPSSTTSKMEGRYAGD